MNSFSSFRRDFLRTGSLGMAAAAIPVRFACCRTGCDTGLDHSGVFDVRNYGATGDGKTLDTDAVNRAIEAAAARAEAWLSFPAGIYLCFSIHLKSHVHLHLDAGQRHRCGRLARARRDHRL